MSIPSNYNTTDHNQKITYCHRNAAIAIAIEIICLSALITTAALLAPSSFKLPLAAGGPAVITLIGCATLYLMRQIQGRESSNAHPVAPAVKENFDPVLQQLTERAPKTQNSPSRAAENEGIPVAPAAKENLDPALQQLTERVHETPNNQSKAAENKETHADKRKFDPVLQQLTERVHETQSNQSRAAENKETPADKKNFDPVLQQLTERVHETQSNQSRAAENKETPADKKNFDPVLQQLTERVHETQSSQSRAAENKETLEATLLDTLELGTVAGDMKFKFRETLRDAAGCPITPHPDDFYIGLRLDLSEENDAIRKLREKKLLVGSSLTLPSTVVKGVEGKFSKERTVFYIDNIRYEIALRCEHARTVESGLQYLAQQNEQQIGWQQLSRTSNYTPGVPLQSPDTSQPAIQQAYFNYIRPYSTPNVAVKEQTPQPDVEVTVTLSSSIWGAIQSDDFFKFHERNLRDLDENGIPIHPNDFYVLVTPSSPGELEAMRALFPSKSQHEINTVCLPSSLFNKGWDFSTGTIQFFVGDQSMRLNFKEQNGVSLSDQLGKLQWDTLNSPISLSGWQERPTEHAVPYTSTESESRILFSFRRGDGWKNHIGTAPEDPKSPSSSLVRLTPKHTRTRPTYRAYDAEGYPVTLLDQGANSSDIDSKAILEAYTRYHQAIKESAQSAS